MSEITEHQQDAIAELNDKWGVDSWSLAEDESLEVVLDDGDIYEVNPEGGWWRRTS